MNKDNLILQMLKDNGAQNIEEYSLVNNYGYAFIFKGVKFDLRHWLNVYGASVNYWACHCFDTSASREDWGEWITPLIDKITKEANKILQDK